MRNHSDNHDLLPANNRNCDAAHNTSQLNKHSQQIARFSEVGVTMFSIFDLNTRQYVYMNTHYARLLSDSAGEDDRTDAPSVFHQGVHPDDLPGVYHAEHEAYRLVGSMPPEARADYFLVTPVRMRKRKGGYRLVLRRILEHTAGRKGELWLLLIAVDVLEEKSESVSGTPMLCNKRIKEMYCLEPGKACTSRKIELTKRELEVVELAGKGYTSNEIAKQLFLSIHTVGTHRKNILRKCNTCNIDTVYTTMQLLGVL
ncbi:MAG: hypothetical protein H6Q17_1954 [Bacteroidetes bacterium]|nr:hypothetical protein [Bacteroidota bacterium]